MTQIDIRLELSGSKGRYVWEAPDGSAAELTYTATGDSRLIVDHTFVPPKFREHGVALKLVERLVADAQADGKTIVPLCPYVAGQFERHPDWAELLAKR